MNTKWFPGLALGVVIGIVIASGIGFAANSIGSYLSPDGRDQVGDISVIYKDGNLTLAKYGAEGGVPFYVYTNMELNTECSGVLYNTHTNPIVCTVPAGSTLNVNSTHAVLTEGLITGTDVYVGDLEP